MEGPAVIYSKVSMTLLEDQWYIWVAADTVYIVAQCVSLAAPC